MNETSATSASGMSLLPDGIATLTAIHFTIIAVVAILVVIGLVWGIRAKRSRVKASHDVIANAKEAGVPPAPIAPASAPAPTPAPAPVEERLPAASQAQVQVQARTPTAPSLTPFADVQSVDAPAVEVPAEPEQLSEQAPPAPVASPVIETTTPVPASPDAAVAKPSAAPADAPSAYRDDPVTQLKGLGPKVAMRLGELGVTTIGQMAALSESEAQSIDAQLGAFTGRMGRDRWIEQARLLAAGDKAGFEAVFGKL